MPESSLFVWIVDDDPSVRWVLEKALQQAGLQTRSFERAEHLLEAIQHTEPDVLVTDVRMPGMDGIALMDRLTDAHPTLPIIVMTAYSDLDSAVSAYRGGAFEYLPKPFDIDEAVELVKKAACQNAVEVSVSDEEATRTLPPLLGKAPAMQEVFRSIGRLAGSSMTVLITGESGTGKELVARALHQHSPRSEKSFVALNTAAIASELLESELFGHERGSFTGADARRIGRFEQADGGTLFLDEIGDMSPALQTSLLRVLAESEFFRVGGQDPVRVDVRVIAATNQDLALAVKEGRFREDLFHRLNVIRINTPPLRQRRQDIPLLLKHYLANAASELNTSPKTLNSDALDLLQAHDWPGNVRQLVNATKRLTVTAPGGIITALDINADFGRTSSAGGRTKEWTQGLEQWAEQQLENDSGEALLDLATPELEKTLIRIAMKKACGRRQEAARLLGWGRNTLTRKIRSLEIE
ncbi:MAG: nitrogen regulation protein NR(I) [Proteobacteria bacterium]|nr:nitrogen regulation protein NR(I) [Pseudomonadota bacterium]